MTSIQELPRDLGRTSLWTLAGWFGLVFTVIVTIFNLPYFLSPGLGSVLRETGQHAYVLAWLLILTTFNRTVRLRTLIAFWFIGIYPAFAISVLVGRPMAAVFGLSGHFVPDFWVPVTEECIKALPVVLYLAWSARRGTWQTSATDGLLLGLAVGSGFAMHEDIVDHRVGGSGFSAGSALHTFFPTAWTNHAHTQFILGHAGWTALVGLAFGLAFLFRRFLLVWLVPIFALGQVSLDHMVTNYVGNLGRDSVPWFIDAARRLLLHDRLPAALLVIGIFVTVVLEQWVLRWASSRDRFFPFIPIQSVVAMVTQSTSVTALLAAREYLRYRRAAHYSAWTWHLGAAPADDVADSMARVVCSYGIMAGASPGAALRMNPFGDGGTAEAAPAEGRA